MIEPGTIIVDTREQNPYSFERMKAATLHTGDYSIEGLEEEVCIERKTLSDAYGTIGQGRERFERELERMAAMRYAAIIIEAGMIQFLREPPQYSRLSPKTAIGSLLSWSVKFGVHIFFCGDRNHGEAATAKLLEKYHKYAMQRAEKLKNGSHDHD